MNYQLQTTIFPDRHTLEIVNPMIRDFEAVDEIIEFAGGFRNKDGKIRSEPGETLHQFAAALARFYACRFVRAPIEETRSLGLFA